MAEDSSRSDLYLLTAPLPPSRPSPTEDLLELYGLQELASSVARQDASGAKRKLRKSYKGHIAGLPGKHPVPGPGETPWGLLSLAHAPPVSAADVASSQALDISPELLAPIQFEHSATGVPGFDAKLLAAPGKPGAAGASGAVSPIHRTGGPQITLKAPTQDDSQQKKRPGPPVASQEKRQRRI